MSNPSPEFTRWQDRYAAQKDYVFGKAPNEFLERCKSLLPKSGTALAIADGEGRNGVWLAEQGLTVTATDFASSGLEKARALAKERGVSVDFILADMHTWDYPREAFDVVADIFTQVSNPAERATKWTHALGALKPGGLFILRGYTPKQLDYGTGGPKVLENLYTRAMLQDAFGHLDDLVILEEEMEVQEGAGHAGMSAMIGLTGRKPA